MRKNNSYKGVARSVVAAGFSLRKQSPRPLFIASITIFVSCCILSIFRFPDAVIPVSLVILPLAIYATEVTSINIAIILTGAVEVVLAAGAIFFPQQLYGYLIAMVVVGVWTFFPVGTLKQHQKNSSNFREQMIEHFLPRLQVRLQYNFLSVWQYYLD